MHPRLRVGLHYICLTALLGAGEALALSDLRLDATHSPVAPEANQAVVTTIHLINDGPHTSQNATFRADFAPGIQILSLDTPNATKGELNGRPFIFCSNGSGLASGKRFSVSVLWRSSAAGTVTTDCSNTPALGSDPDLSNNTMSFHTTFAADSGRNLPTVGISRPYDGASFDAGATVTLETQVFDSGNGAADPFGIAKVEFFKGATKLGEDTTRPYSFAWTNVPAGTHSVTAVAVDNDAAGTRVTSTPIRLVIEAEANQAPQIQSEPSAQPNPVALSAGP